MKNIMKEFEEMIYLGFKSQGIDDLAAKLLALLYANTSSQTVEDLAAQTGYSPSAVSATMKMLSRTNIVQVIKQGGSKKLYFTVQRDMLTIMLNSVKSKNERVVVPALENIPVLLDKCKQNKSTPKELVEIIKKYHHQMIGLNKILNEITRLADEIQKEGYKE